MPLANSFLSEQEKCDFGMWLTKQLSACNISKKSLSKALRESAESTAELNRYLKGQVLPLPKTVRTLAKYLNIPASTALLRAGYLTELIDELPSLLAIGKAYCDEDGLDFEQCIKPDAMQRYLSIDRYLGGCQSSKSSDQESPPIGILLPVTSDEKIRPLGRFVIPWPTVSATYLAVEGFPLRSETRRAEASFFLSISRPDTIKRPGRPPIQLTLAKKILGAKNISKEVKRAAAGEFVRSWIMGECKDFAKTVVLGIYGHSTSSLASLTFYPEETNAQ